MAQNEKHVKVVGALGMALVHGREVRVTYTTGAGVKSRRTVKPVTFEPAANGANAIVFKVIEAGEWKSLRSDRCENVRQA
jgi:hypothetical protein